MMKIIFHIKFSKTQLSKIVKSGGSVGSLWEPLLKIGLSLIGNILKLLAKSVLIQLGLTVTAWATDETIHKKMFGSGFTALIISNEEMNDIMKIFKFLEESGLIIKAYVKQLKMKQKNKKEDFSECY